jgi:hypothetical protein
MILELVALEFVAPVEGCFGAVPVAVDEDDDTVHALLGGGYPTTPHPPSHSRYGGTADSLFMIVCLVCNQYTTRGCLQTSERVRFGCSIPANDAIFWV